MHMISKKDLNAAELETVTTLRSPTTVVTANCEVQMHEEAIVYFRKLDFLDNETPRGYASSSIAGKALQWTRMFIRVDQRSKATSHLKWYSNAVQHGELRSDRGSWLVTEFFLPLSFFSINDLSKQEVDHPTSSSSSSTSPTVTSITVSSESG